MGQITRHAYLLQCGHGFPHVLQVSDGPLQALVQALDEGEHLAHTLRRPAVQRGTKRTLPHAALLGERQLQLLRVQQHRAHREGGGQLLDLSLQLLHKARDPSRGINIHTYRTHLILVFAIFLIQGMPGGSNRNEECELSLFL